MARDSTAAIRIAVMAYMAANAGIAAIADDRIHSGPTVEPIWPFVRYGATITLPHRASGLDAVRVALTIHTFAKDDMVAGVDGEDQAGRLAAAVADGLDGAVIGLDTPYPAKIYDVMWTSTQVIADSEVASAFHGVVNLEAKVAS